MRKNLEVISPEIEIDIKPDGKKTLVRVIDIPKGEIIFEKAVSSSPREIKEDIISAIVMNIMEAKKRFEEMF